MVVVVHELMLMKISQHYFPEIKTKSYDILCWRIIPHFFEISLQKRGKTPLLLRWPQLARFR